MIRPHNLRMFLELGWQETVLTISTKYNIVTIRDVVESNTTPLQKVERRETGTVSTQSHHPYH